MSFVANQRRIRKGAWVLACALLTFTAGVPAQTVTHDGRNAQTIIRYDDIHHPVIARQGMVVSQNDVASRIGAAILANGGNAVDAAVATGFALAVTVPRAGNLGGSGFMLIHLAEESRTIAVDYRSMAPVLASDERFRDGEGKIDMGLLTFGPMGSGVPGTVAAFHQAWRRFGSMPWQDLLEPARKLAAEGLLVSYDLSYVLSQTQSVLARFPSSARTYLKADGSAPLPGETLVLPDLAWSIGQIGEHGADAFYRGELGRRIAAAFESSGGLIRMSDLEAYEVKEREPVSTDYRGHRIVSMPPVSGGGVTLIQMLNTLSHFPLGDSHAGSASTLHILAEVMKRGAANRRAFIGDPDFSDLPVQAYTSRALAKKMAGDISLVMASDARNRAPEPMQAYESRETTHYSVMDRHGNAVSNTYTLGYSFGSGFVAEGTGILFDNQMRNFKYDGGPDHPNALKPGKRMMSSMTPAIVLDGDGKVELVTGTPGGSRIVNVVLQIIVNVIDHGMGIAEATHRPRIHQDSLTSGKLGVEVGMSPDTVNVLRALGHEVEWQMTMGSTQSIQWKDGLFYGSADPRRPNALAVGVEAVKEPVRHK